MLKPLKAWLLLIIILIIGVNKSFAGPCDESKWALDTASRITGLPVKIHTECKSFSREEFRKLTAEVILRDIDYKQLPYEEAVLKFLGAIPFEYEYDNCLVDTYSTSAAAFYSPFTKTLNFPDWSETPRVVQVHEAVHALQDQNFNTIGMGTRKFILSDENFASQALLEGDAMDTEEVYLKELKEKETIDPDIRMKLETKDKKCEMPALLNDIISSPYMYGLAFIGHVKVELGPKYRDTVFRINPFTTEQILHYKKYFAGESFFQIPLSKKAVFSERLGELFMRAYLKSYLNDKEAVLAAGGWNGDRISLIVNKKEKNILWETHWDTPEDAEAFRRAISKVWSIRFKQPLNENVKAWDLQSGEFGTFQMRQKSDVILISGGLPG